MSDMPQQQSDRDDALAAAYRALPAELPPPALDDAIRAAARCAVSAGPQPAGAGFVRRWQMPMSIAAVLVLCVSLVTLMRDEGSNLTEVPRADVPPAAAPAREAADSASAVPKVELTPDAKESKNLGLKPPAAKFNAPLADNNRYQLAAPSTSLGMQSPGGDSSTAKLSAKQDSARLQERRAAPSAFPESTEIAAVPAEATPQSTVREKDRRDLPVRAEPAPVASGGRVGTENAVVAAAGAAKSALQEGVADRVERDSTRAVPAAPAAAKVAPAAEQAGAVAEPARVLGKMSKETAEEVGLMAQLPPDKWLARIEELRRLGRVAEARAGLLEFRKRYPDYALPPALRDWIQP